MANKAVFSYAAHDSAYTYCPNRAMMITTRHNVINFDVKFLTILSNSITLRRASLLLCRSN